MMARANFESPESETETSRPDEVRISRRTAVVIVVAIVALGSLWTLYWKKTAIDPMTAYEERINAINAQVIVQKRKTSSTYVTTPPHPKPAPAPAAPERPRSSLAHDQAIALLEQCRDFQLPVGIRMPKAIPADIYNPSLTRYPILASAVREGFAQVKMAVAVEGDTVYTIELHDGRVPYLVSITPAGRSAFSVHDLGTHFVIDAGRRRIVDLTYRLDTPERVTAEFQWSFESEALTRLAAGQFKPRTSVFIRKSANWVVSECPSWGENHF